MNRGRIQAQDTFLEESESWATLDEINKEEGITMNNSLKNKLTRKQLNERLEAFRKVESIIIQAPSYGYSAQIIKSFHHDPKNRRVRVDLEIRSGRAFID